MINDFKQILVDDREIKKLCVELATRINEDYKGNDNVIFVGLLYGCYPFFSDLLKEINFHFSYDVMNVKSYGDAIETSGEVRIVTDLVKSIEGKDVIIVDDIIDSGVTLNALSEVLKSRGANSVESVVLLQKEGEKDVPVNTKYIGGMIKDVWLAGYGLDFRNKYRYCNFIGELKREITHPDAQ